jgi:hypothetical protein
MDTIAPVVPLVAPDPTITEFGNVRFAIRSDCSDAEYAFRETIGSARKSSQVLICNCPPYNCV